MLPSDDCGCFACGFGSDSTSMVCDARASECGTGRELTAGAEGGADAPQCSQPTSLDTPPKLVPPSLTSMSEVTFTPGPSTSASVGDGSGEGEGGGGGNGGEGGGGGDGGGG